MLKYLKYIPQMLGLFKDTTKAYKESEGTDRPAWLSQRFIGAIITGIGGLLASLRIIELPEGTIEGLSNSIPSVVDMVLVIWGQVIAILGAYKAQKRSE